MPHSNKSKFNHEQSAKEALEALLEHSKDSGYIRSMQSNYYNGYKEFKNEKQFYAPFLIEFDDNNLWILYSTTSCRTERINEQQWDAFNLKRINPRIEKALLTYPDSVSGKEKMNFKKLNESYKSDYNYSAIDGVISQSETALLIQNEALGKLKVG